jgi:hypothetical protein
MKRSNDIYFLTLIDLLVQALFLGLLLYAIGDADQTKEKQKQEIETSRQQAEQRNIDALLEATGVSNLTELTDELTKLAPIKELKGTADFISKIGGADDANRLADMAAEHGGVSKLSKKLEEAKVTASLVVAAGGAERLAAVVKKIEEGSGKPPCLYTEAGDKKVAKPVATVVANDSTITFQGSNPDLEALLLLLKKPYASVERLPIQEFTLTFAPLLRIKPECRFTLRFIERTNFVHARDAVQKAFYTAVSK